MAKSPLYLWNPGCPCCDVEAPYFHVLRFNSSGVITGAFRHEEDPDFGCRHVAASNSGKVFGLSFSSSSATLTDYVIPADWSSVDYSQDICGNGHGFFWIEGDSTPASPGDASLFAPNDRGSGERMGGLYESDLSLRWENTTAHNPVSDTRFSTYGDVLYWTNQAKSIKATSAIDGSDLWTVTHGIDHTMFFKTSVMATSSGCVAINNNATNRTNQIAHFNSADGSIDWSASVDSNYEPQGLFVDNNSGDIYVVSTLNGGNISANDRIKRYDSSGSFQNDIGTGDIGRHTSLWVDGSGYVYILNEAGTDYLIYSPAGVLQDTVEIPMALTLSRSGYFSSNGPNYLSVDSDGNVYISGGLNKLPDGTEYGSFVSAA